MATAYGTMIYVGVSGRTYVKDLYFGDTAGKPINFDNGSGASASSENNFLTPEAGAITDVIMASATAQTKLQVTANGAPSGDILRDSVHLASVAFRPRLNIPFAKAGVKIQLIELA